MRRLIATLGVVVLAVVVVPGAPARTDVRSGAKTIGVTLGRPAEMRITLSTRTASSGTVTFTVVNRGKVPHDFSIAGKKTRTLKTGERATLRVRLSKGRAAYKCTIPGHAAAGMKGSLRVV